jgi:hypothetical protein
MNTPTVMLPCVKEPHPTDDVIFLDVSEGPQGEDLLTYVCPRCEAHHTSVVTVTR